jgi:hypothetical protein
MMNPIMDSAFHGGCHPTVLLRLEIDVKTLVAMLESTPRPMNP